MKPGQVATLYREAVQNVLQEKGGLELVTKVYNRLLQKEKAGALEEDEAVRLVVLREVAHQN